MKASDHIVEFFIKKRITANVTYHEQGAASAACGYAQTSGKPGVAYVTLRPGATNLVTDIANAFFDSIPAIFINGQVNSNEVNGDYGVGQRGFQETDIASIVKPVTKYAVYVADAVMFQAELENAYQIAMSRRREPVFLNILMNVFRMEINVEDLRLNDEYPQNDVIPIAETLSTELQTSTSPVFLIGGGVKSAGMGYSLSNFFGFGGQPTAGYERGCAA